ncbi:hypothetical protein RhiirA1_513425 [Rhizophagus irregularis]|uniref:Uncharacterized protein n=1 Tax=Rhizophagus irregularis TaxID=588596 RepID=A0A2N0QP87_9GLOM|nr:hypothetical protein RhiirA1_513425 [Rhizophagus irregularis]
MVFVNCVVEENIPIEASIDTSANVNCISQKHIGELGITYHSESNRIETPDASYSTLGKVDLHIGFNDSKKHKSTPVEFIVLGLEWSGPDLILGGPWFQENGATLDICNSNLLLDNNFAIPFKEVDYISTLSDSQIRAMTDFPSPTYSPE